MTSIMAMDLVCSNAPVNWNGHLDNKVRNRVLLSVVGAPTLIVRADNLSYWLPFKLEDIEGIIMATSNGASKGTTALGSPSSALTWSSQALTYGNSPASGNVEILLIGRMAQ